MAYDPILDADVTAGNPASASRFARKTKGNLEFLYGVLGGVNEPTRIINPLLSIDTDEDGIPDSWTRHLYAGGSGAIETAAPLFGDGSYTFTSPGGAGNGGGYLESDYVLTTEFAKSYLQFLWHATAAGLHTRILARWFDVDRVSISDETIFDSLASAASRVFLAGLNPPAGARWVKFRLIGGLDDETTAGDVGFGGLSFNRLLLPMPALTELTLPATDAYVYHEVGWIDLLTMKWPLPYANIPLRLSFDFEGLFSTSATMEYRIRIGSCTSPVAVAGPDDYRTTSFVFDLSAADTQVGELELVLQINKFFFGVGDFVKFRKSNPAMDVQFTPGYGLTHAITGGYL